MRRWILLGLGIALAVSYLATGMTQVLPGERAVVRRLGRVLDEKPGPGLWFGLPWGLDRVDRVAVDQVRRLAVGYNPEQESDQPTPPGQFLTGDHNLVNVRIDLHYSVWEDQIVDYLQQKEQAERLIARTAETLLAEWLAQRTVDEVLLHAKADLPGWLIERTPGQSLGRLQQRLEPYHLGIRLREASVAQAGPPDEVKQAFDEVTQAQTRIRTQVHEAEQQALNDLRQAEADKNDIEKRAASYAYDQRQMAQTEAEKFLERLRQYQRLSKDNPDFLAGIWHDQMGKLFSKLKENGRIDLLDHHLGPDGLDVTLMPMQPRKR
jgi:membrane protease subunit HflK